MFAPRRSRICPLVLVLSFLSGMSPASAGEPAAVAAPDIGPSDDSPSPDPDFDYLELRIDPLVDLYFAIRAQAADAEAPPWDGYEDAVEAARGLQASLGTFGGWGPIDTRVLSASTPETLLEGFLGFPEPYRRRGTTLSLRDDAVQLARALARQMPEFMDSRWPARREALERRLALVEERLMPRHREAFRFMLTSLAIPDPRTTLPVFLVLEANPPGAMTYSLRGGRPVSVLASMDDSLDSQFLELILHEATHALEDPSSEPQTVFGRLREALEQRGLERGDEALYEIPHTLMFVQAEETMRRVVDPSHVAYGEAVSGLYTRLEPIPSVVREVWRRHLDDELEQNAALTEIVERLVPQR